MWIEKPHASISVADIAFYAANMALTFQFTLVASRKSLQ